MVHCDVIATACVAQTPGTPCSVEATLNRSAAVLGDLRTAIATLSAAGTDVQLEAVTVVMAEVFAEGIAQDAALPLQTAVKILEVASERASLWGWAEPPRMLLDIARSASPRHLRCAHIWHMANP